MDPLEVLGIGSALMVLFAFVANEYGKLNVGDFKYDFFNFLGAIGLFMYAFQVGVVPFMVTNGVWALISGLDIVKYIKKPKRRKARKKS